LGKGPIPREDGFCSEPRELMDQIGKKACAPHIHGVTKFGESTTDAEKSG